MQAKHFVIGSITLSALMALSGCNEKSGDPVGTSSSSSSVASSSSSSSSNSSSSSSSASSASSSSSSSSSSSTSSSSSSSAATMMVTSTGFVEDAIIPAKFSCDGINVNPELQWSDVPTGTQSFAVIVDDPDAFAAFGVVWVHWNAYNIPGTASEILEAASNHADQMPIGTVEGVSDFGTTGYRGPCPPSGSHHYHFAIYALNKASITMVTPSTREEFEAAHAADILTKGELTGRFR